MAFRSKPLNQAEYSMNIIEDLGNILNDKGTRKARFAIVECTECKKHFKLRMGSTKAKKQEKCLDCAISSHKFSKHPLYPVWNSIIQRCYNTKRKDYHKYGGKGVTVCDEWRDSPSKFIEWCEKNGWQKGLEVDKDLKSKELGLESPIYSPDTVTFLTQEENTNVANNKAVNQYDKELNLIASYDSCTKAALSLGKPKSSKSSIANCARGLTKTSFGFIWKFKN